MRRLDQKLEQIKLQHEIGELLRRDNGVSCHFDYHVNLMSAEETVMLNLLTYNPKHEEYMLLHTVKGKSSLHCLELMKLYVQSLNLDSTKYSFTITWRRKGEDKFHISYFHSVDEESARAKFLHEKDPEQFEFEIKQNPIA